MVWKSSPVGLSINTGYSENRRGTISPNLRGKLDSMALAAMKRPPRSKPDFRDPWNRVECDSETLTDRPSNDREQERCRDCDEAALPNGTLPIHQPWTMKYAAVQKVHVSHNRSGGVNDSPTASRDGRNAPESILARIDANVRGVVLERRRPQPIKAPPVGTVLHLRDNPAPVTLERRARPVRLEGCMA